VGGQLALSEAARGFMWEVGGVWPGSPVDGKVGSELSGAWRAGVVQFTAGSVFGQGAAG